MVALKYQKYIVTEAKAPPVIPAYRHESAAVSSPNMTRLAYLDDDVISGAPHMACMWLLPGERRQTDKPGVDAHVHDDFDEVLGFYGSDPYNPRDLGGEIEFWIEDEKYLLTKSCTVYLPRGIRHCPLLIRRIDRPIFHFGTTRIFPK